MLQVSARTATVLLLALYFLSWLILCSSLLAYWFGILCCEMAALLRLCYQKIVYILNTGSHGVNKSATLDRWKLLCLYFQGSLSWIISSFFTWQNTRLKSVWKYLHCVSIIIWKKLSKNFYSSCLWVRLSTVFHMLWLS